MKTHVLTFAIAALAMGAIAGAQTPPSSTTSPSASQSSSSTTTQTPSGSYSSSSSSTDSKTQMKDCMAKQKTMNPQISDADAKKACKTD